MKMDYNIAESNWRPMVYEATQKKSNAFFETNNGMVEQMFTVQYMVARRISVHKIIYDNAGDDFFLKKWQTGRIGNWI